MTIPGVTKRSTASEMEQREAMMREIAPILARYGYDAATVVLFTPELVNVQSVGAEGKSEACTVQAQHPREFDPSPCRARRDLPRLLGPARARPEDRELTKREWKRGRWAQKREKRLRHKGWTRHGLAICATVTRRRSWRPDDHP